MERGLKTMMVTGESCTTRWQNEDDKDADGAWIIQNWTANESGQRRQSDHVQLDGK